MGCPSVDQVWARYYIEHTLHDLYHWAEGFGVKWVDMKPQEGNSVMRWTRTERSGLGLMSALIGGFLGRGGDIAVNTKITKITKECNNYADLGDFRRNAVFRGGAV